MYRTGLGDTITIQGPSSLTNSLSNNPALGYNEDLNDGSLWASTIAALTPETGPNASGDNLGLYDNSSIASFTSNPSSMLMIGLAVVGLFLLMRK